MSVASFRSNNPTAPGLAGTAASRLRRVALAALLLLTALLSLAPQTRAEEEFLDPEQAFQLAAAMASPTELVVQFTVAPKYYMYREQFRFEITPAEEAGRLGEPRLPPGKVKYDPTFDKELEVYYGQVRVALPLQPGAAQPLTLAITSQGCADAGLCYSPMQLELQLLPTAAGYDVAGQGAGPMSRLDAAGGQAGAAGAAGGLDAVLNFGDLDVADYLAQAGLLNIVAICLLLGLLLSFTPCVLPMVPILLTLIAGANASVTGRQGASTAGSGQQAGRDGQGVDAAATGGGRLRGLTLAFLYVLGMSLVYTGLGVAAGLLGASLAAWLQSPWLLALFAALLALLALAMFDVFTFQAPAAMQSALNARLSRIPGGRHGGAFLMGMLSALIVGPCVAAPLAGVLLFISQTGDVLLGGLALFALAWGQGILLLAVGASSGALLPRAGAWMERVKHVFGVLLLATAWWMLIPVLPSVVLMLGWAVLALWAAILFGALRPVPADVGPWHMLARAVGYLLALWGAAILVGLAAGGRDALHPLSVFGQSGAAPAAAWQSSAAPGVAPGMASGVAAAPLAAGQSAFSQSGAAQSASGNPAAVLPWASTGAGAAAPGVPGQASPVLGSAAHPPFVRVRSVEELDRFLAGSDKPVMLDFYADWCVSCIEMERFTFSEPGVAQLLARFTLLQADVTANTPQDRELLKRFRLFGPPGIIFFDRQGRAQDDARVIGFQNAARFSGVLQRVLAQY